VLAQMARSGQSSRAALRPTVRSADGAASLGDRGGKNSKLRLPSGVLDGHAPPLTLSLGPRVEGVYGKGLAQSRLSWQMTGHVRVGVLVTRQGLRRPAGGCASARHFSNQWCDRSAKAGRDAVAVAGLGPAFAGVGRGPAVTAWVGAGAKRGQGVGGRGTAFGRPGFRVGRGWLAGQGRVS